METPTTQWPKRLQTLTEEQERIRNDFMNHWLTVLPNRYGVIEKFNHTYPLRTYTSDTRTTLDIGAGRGEHASYEDLESQEYVALELRPSLADAIRARFPRIRAITGDIQGRIDVPSGYFDRILAIHILEHLPDLPKAVDEVYRLLKPTGAFSVVIPCEGGMAYSLARNISARRIFEKRYKQSYDWFVACEHINRPAEILRELERRFDVVHRDFFPLKVPLVSPNLVIGLTLRPRR